MVIASVVKIKQFLVVIAWVFKEKDCLVVIALFV